MVTLCTALIGTSPNSVKMLGSNSVRQACGKWRRDLKQCYFVFIAIDNNYLKSTLIYMKYNK